MTPLGGRRILDLSAACAQRPHALAVSMAGLLCRQYGAVVVRPGAAETRPHEHRYLDHGKHPGSTTGRFDAAIGDTQALTAHATGIPVQACLSVFAPGEDPPVTELGLLAMSGLLGAVTDEDGTPARLAGHQVPYAAGLSACIGLLAAVRAARPEMIDVSLFDVACWLNWKLILGAALGLTSPERSDWTTLPARDGHVALVYQDKDWPELRDMIGVPGLYATVFDTRAGRQRERAALLGLLRPWMAARTRADIVTQAQARRIPIGAVLSPVELRHDPQMRARAFLAADGAPAMPLMCDGRRVGAGHG